MGGYGSGRRGGIAAPKTTDYHKIDMRWLRTNGLLQEGKISSITWSRCGTVTASIRVETSRHGLRVAYKNNPPGGKTFNVDEIIPWAWTHTAFGGRRRWFQCPRCKDRCNTLYGGAYFRCRSCHGLQHPSKCEPAQDRALERATRLRERLGDTVFSAFECDELPPKPKRMRWRTYRRLEVRYAHLQRQWKLSAIARFGSEVLSEFGIEVEEH